MKVVFMGTPDFAEESLKALINSDNEIIAVFTGADKQRGRGHNVLPTPVKELALKEGIPVYQPDTLRSDEVYAQLKTLNPDIIVVAAYGKILPDNILKLPEYGCINVHGSLLPKYRGAAPIQWAVLNGDKQTGVTIMQMADGIDTGDILYVKTIDIGDRETSGELFDRMSILGGQALVEAIELLSEGKIIPKPQDDSLAVHAPKITKEMSQIDWNESAKSVKNKIYGLQPWPSAKINLNGIDIKLLGAEVVANHNAPVGLLYKKDKGLYVGCGDGNSIRITELQKAGSKRMSAEQFLCGFNLQDDVYLNQ